MARVLLAKARFLNEGGMGAVAPLGILYIASVLREAGHDVRVFDAGELWDPAPFRETIQAFRPDVVGLSAITIEARVMEQMARVCRDEMPDVPIIVGGPHATAYPERCARHPDIDYVVLGEGELTALELVRALTRGGIHPHSVAGIAYRGDDGSVVFTAPREPILDVDSIPFPSWDLMDFDLQSRTRAMSSMGSRRHMLLFTSRGCPFKCIYCHEVQGKKFRARSPENVVREMHELKSRWGVNDFEVVDDIFNFDRRRMLDILDRIVASKLEPALHFPNALRTDMLDEGQIKALRRAGTFFLCAAVETASPRLQKVIKKHLKIDQVEENIRIAVREGMYVRGFFMLGFPTETLDEAHDTVRFALRSVLHEALFFIVTPFAGTALYELYQDALRERGMLELEPEDTGYHQGSYNLSAMTDAELFGLQRRAFRQFFLDPRRAVRIAARHPAKLELLRYGLLTLLKMVPHPGARRSKVGGGTTIGPVRDNEPESPRVHLATGWNAAEPVRRMDTRGRNKAVATAVSH
jgi:radical SAM superfamily enzyme YgiQ (UPF0313 family)